MTKEFMDDNFLVNKPFLSSMEIYMDHQICIPLYFVGGEIHIKQNVPRFNFVHSYICSSAHNFFHKLAYKTFIFSTS